MSIDLPDVEGTSEKYGEYSDLKKYTFYTESTLRKLFCKPKDRVATKYKYNIVYEIDYSNYKAVYFGEPKRSLKSLYMNLKDLSWIAIVKRMKLQTLLGSRS